MKQIKNLTFGQPVRIHWEDSATAGGWNQPNSEGIGDIVSLGFITSNNRKAVTISDSIDKKTLGILTPLSIPWPIVTKVEVLPDKYKSHSK